MLCIVDRKPDTFDWWIQLHRGRAGTRTGDLDDIQRKKDPQEVQVAAQQKVNDVKVSKSESASEPGEFESN